jgi:hypothetical protein
LVVITITPLADLDPYIADAVASFKIVMLSISSGGILPRPWSAIHLRLKKLHPLAKAFHQVPKVVRGFL